MARAFTVTDCLHALHVGFLKAVKILVVKVSGFLIPCCHK